MKKIAVLSAFCLALSACTSLSHHEQNTIRSLNSYGISVDKPAENGKDLPVRLVLEH